FLLLVPAATVFPLQLLGDGVYFGACLTLACAQIYRYRRVATLVQRQQIKWVVFGFAVGILLLSGTVVMALFVPSLPHVGSLCQGFLVTALGNLYGFLIALCFGIAILRYRLWNIDVILTRTLAYGGLTVSIIAAYILIVGGLGAFFQSSGSLVIS